MNGTLLICATLLLIACAAPQEVETDTKEQAIRDYIAIHGLAEVDKMRTFTRDKWSEVDPRFVIYETRSEAFLLEFVRDCYELNETPVVADVRRDNVIRARFDTLVGCRIAAIYALTDADVAELDSIGALPQKENK